MKTTVSKESYVERFTREQKEKKGTPVKTETGTPVKEGKTNGKNTRSKGQETTEES